MEAPREQQLEERAAAAPSPPPTNLTDVALGGSATPPRPHQQQQGDDQEEGAALPTTHTAPPAVYHLPGGIEVSEAEPLGQLLTRLRWASARCIEGMDYVGGAVAGFLGITDSKFQYVLDQMSEEDLAAARTDLQASRAEGPPILLEEISQRQLGQGSVELAAGGHV